MHVRACLVQELQAGSAPLSIAALLMLMLKPVQHVEAWDALQAVQGGQALQRAQQEENALLAKQLQVSLCRDFSSLASAFIHCLACHTRSSTRCFNEFVACPEALFGRERLTWHTTALSP